MTGAATALLLAALGVLLVRGPSPVTARMRLMHSAPGIRARLPGRRSSGTPVGLLLPAGCGAAGLAAWARLGFGAEVPVLPAVAGGIAAATAARVLSRTAAERQGRRTAASLVEAVGALAADLRAGQPPADALAVLSADPRSVPATRHRAVRAVWAVSESSGAPAAAVLDRVEQDLRTRATQRQEVTAQLAGARSTAGLLAGLPILGIGLGAGMGAQALRVLLGEPRGQLALLAGVTLETLGVLWTARIVAAAEGAP